MFIIRLIFFYQFFFHLRSLFHSQIFSYYFMRKTFPSIF
nr:MAG TPA: hypothetical protein [Bacteriophage sp.]